jgi:hypothetical protein
MLRLIRALTDRNLPCAGRTAALSAACVTAPSQHLSDLLIWWVGFHPRQDPKEEKFRRIRLSNAAFQGRVGSVPGALDFLQLLGFETDAAGEFLVMPAGKADAESLHAAGGELQNALTNPFFGAL